MSWGSSWGSTWSASPGPPANSDVSVSFSTQPGSLHDVSLDIFGGYAYEHTVAFEAKDPFYRHINNVSFAVVPNFASQDTTVAFNALDADSAYYINKDIPGYSIPHSGSSGVDPKTAVFLGAFGKCVISADVSFQPNEIVVQMEVTPDHPFAQGTLGQIYQFSLLGRHFTLPLKSRSYQPERGIYSITLSYSIEDFFDAPIDAKSLIPEHPAEQIIKNQGFVCLEALESLSNASRPSVRDAINTAAKGLGIKALVLDESIPGLGDKVPFGFLHDQEFVTFSDLINGLIGWAQPRYFLFSDLTVYVIGGWPYGARSGSRSITGIPDPSISETFYELPTYITVNGGPWPEKRQPPPSTGCSVDSPEPSELENATLVSKTENDSQRITTEIVKSCGRIVREKRQIYQKIVLSTWRFGNQYTSESWQLAEEEIKTYTYDDSCPEKLLEEYRVVNQNKWSTAYTNPTPSYYVEKVYPEWSGVYEEERIKYEWSPKGYLSAKHSSRKQLMDLTTTNVGGILKVNSVNYEYYGSEEQWKPLGKGLWFHTSTSSSKKSFRVYNPDFPNQPDLSYIVTRPVFTTVSEITDSGPMTTRCPRQDSCSPQESCKLGSTSNASEGLTSYKQDVTIPGGTLPPSSISVPGINNYSNRQTIYPDSPSSPCAQGVAVYIPSYIYNPGSYPEMNIANNYALYAAKAGKPWLIARWQSKCDGLAGIYTPGNQVFGLLITGLQVRIKRDKNGPLEVEAEMEGERYLP